MGAKAFLAAVTLVSDKDKLARILEEEKNPDFS